MPPLSELLVSLVTGLVQCSGLGWGRGVLPGAAAGVALRSGAWRLHLPYFTCLGCVSTRLTSHRHETALKRSTRASCTLICAFLALKRYLSLVPASPMMSVHDVDEKATCVLLWGCNPHLP